MVWVLLITSTSLGFRLVTRDAEWSSLSTIACLSLVRVLLLWCRDTLPSNSVLSSLFLCRTCLPLNSPLGSSLWWSCCLPGKCPESSSLWWRCCLPLNSVPVSFAGWRLCLPWKLESVDSEDSSDLHKNGFVSIWTSLSSLMSSVSLGTKPSSTTFFTFSKSSNASSTTFSTLPSLWTGIMLASSILPSFDRICSDIWSFMLLHEFCLDNDPSGVVLAAFLAAAFSAVFLAASSSAASTAAIMS